MDRYLHIFRIIVPTLFLLLSSTAVAQEESPSFIENFDFQLGTEAPVSLGGRGSFRFPYGIEAALGVGYMPGVYVDAINKLLVALNAYEETTAALIKDSIKNSLVLDVQLGWDPIEAGGFFFNFGFSMVTLGGSVGSTALIKEVTGVENVKFIKEREIPVSTTLHNVTAHFGYKVYILDDLSLALALGAFKTFDSTTSVNASFEGPRIEEALTGIDDYMNEIYVKYVVTPTLSLWFGYRL
ncbi:MAG: hypothetical protein Kow0090_14090 [Myxococcota bacterium]